MTKTLILTAAVLILGASAYAQEMVLAKIPFSFQIRGVELPAGKYTVAPQLDGAVLRFRNTETGKTVLVMPRNATESKNAIPRIVFNCADGGCWRSINARAR